jgi:signal transduction histidine kinase/DNA-binding NarL/FixJ family response regulator
MAVHGLQRFAGPAARPSVEAIVEGAADAFYVFDERGRCVYVNERALELTSDLTGRALSREDLLDRTVEDVLPAFAGAELENHVPAAAEARQTVIFELPLGHRWFQLQVTPAPRGLTLTVRELTRRKGEEARRRRSLRQQTAIADLARQAATGRDLQALLEHAVELVMKLVGADLAFVAERVRVGDGAFRLRAGAGCPTALVGTLLAPVTPGSLLGRAVAQEDPVVWDPGQEPVDIVAPGLSVGGGVGVNVPGAEGPFGVLGALTRRPQPFEAGDIAFVRAVANVLAVAAERARSTGALVEIREAERRRIARALHDEVLQDLGLAIILAAKPPPPGQGDPPALAVLRRVGEHVHAAIHDLRLSADGSRPVGELLEELVAHHRRHAPQLTLELHTRALPAHPLDRRGTELLRIVGEALTNARRHAAATTVTIRAWSSSGCLWADVRDDGRGFETQTAATGGHQHGLLGMRERATLLGGRVAVTSAPGDGTTVQITVPLGDRASVEERLRLLLVEDHASVREAMATALDAEPDVRDVRQAGSLAEARSALDGVDVAVIDLVLPDGSGADLIEDVRRRNPDAQTLIVTACADPLATARAVERGAAGVLRKEAHLHDVMAAIRRLRRGESLMPLTEVVELLRAAGRRRERELDDRRLLGSLTPREREVLQLMADGLDTREAAARLHVSPRTQRNHVANILAKLGVHSQLQALLFALRYDVVEIGEREATA